MATYQMDILPPPSQPIPNIAIEFTSGNIFIAGQLVRGQVRCLFYDDPILINIEMNYQGQGKILGNQAEEDEFASTRCEEYLNKSLYLFDTGSEPTNMMRGRYAYPFSFQLPESIPSSIEGEYGYIRYSLRVTLLTRLRRVLEPVTSCTETFTVIANMPLPLSAEEPIEKEGSGRFGCMWGRWLCMCLFWKIPIDGLMVANCKLQKGGYVPGENITLSANVTNHSNWEMELIVKFVQRIRYKKLNSTKKEKKILFKWKVSEPTSPFIELKIPVADIPPSSPPFTQLISVDYYIKFEASAVFDLIFPVLIGTDPSRYRNTIQLIPTELVASAPPLELVPGPNEKPEKYGQNDLPSYEEATGYSSDRNNPSEFKPSANQNPASYNIRTSEPYSWTPLLENK